MNIQLITMWYNEEFLAPFFLNHYSWVDRIHIILDADTNDQTESIACRYPNVEIHPFRFPDMMNDILKSTVISQTYQSLGDADYVIVVDSDEFIFPYDLSRTVRDHLRTTHKDVYFVNLWQIYQHKDDLPLDPALPVYEQRRHGDPDMETTDNIGYLKPIVVRGGLDVFWGIGNHYIVHNGIQLEWTTRKRAAETLLDVATEKKDMLQGSHWRLMDLAETIKRRIVNRKQRQSHVNLERGLTAHYHQVTEADIVREYETHRDDPVVIHSTAAWSASMTDDVHCELAQQYFDQALILAGEGAHDYAQTLYRRCLQIIPGYHAARVNLAWSLGCRDDFAAAVKELAVVVEQVPDHLQARLMLGRALLKQGRAQAAWEQFSESIRLNPDNPEVLRAAAEALYALQRYDMARLHIEQALAINPEERASLALLASIERTGNPQRADAIYRLLIQQRPDDHLIHFFHATLLLSLGHFTEGWREFEERIPTLQMSADILALPRWHGQSLSGKSIVLVAEQGHGDALQFIRYASLLAGSGARVLVLCHNDQIRPLLATVAGVSAAIIPKEAVPFLPDYYCPLMSLPYEFGTMLENIPGLPAYLSPDQVKKLYWQQRLDACPGLKVGVVWAGNRAQADNDKRSIPLGELRELLHTAGVTFISLQVGPDALEFQTDRDNLPLVDWSDDLHDFSDTAALVSNLDLVISICSAVTHLSGGLGCPTWVMLQYDADWRWLRDRDDSPWYPSLRLFRQQEPGQWAPVVQSLQEALRSLRAAETAETTTRAAEFYQQGVAYFNAGDLSTAQTCFQCAVEADNRFCDALNGLATILDQRGDTRGAATQYRRALLISPDNALILFNLANSLRKAGGGDEAEELYRRAILISPGFYQAWSGLGNLLLQTERVDEAEATLHKGLALYAQQPDVLCDLGVLAARCDQLVSAEDYFKRALVIDPHHPAVLNHLGMMLMRLNRLEESESCLRRAVAAKPDYWLALNNLGVLLHWEGRLDESEACHRRFIAAQPDNGTPHFNLSLALLSHGKWGEGWAEYEYRFSKENPVPIRYAHVPRWQGDDIHGRSILIHAEQGYGDTIQFARYLPLLIKRGARVILECQDRIISPLFDAFPGIERVIVRDEETVVTELQLPLMSLPLVLGESAWREPVSVCYLTASPHKAAVWRERLAQLPGRRVGLVWSGRRGQDNNHNRMIPPEIFARLAGCQGVSFVNLLVGLDDPQADKALAVLNMFDVRTEIATFADTAAILDSLDLLISVDTATAHLAGALGKDAWVMIPYNADWRWTFGLPDCPLYPSVRLYRQEQPFVWEPVLDAVCRDLASCPEQGAASSDVMLRSARAARDAFRWQEALTAFERVLEREPEDREALTGVGACLQMLNRCEEAVIRYDRALALDPEDIALHCNRALALLTAGRYTEGWQEFQWRKGMIGAGLPPVRFLTPELLAQGISGARVLVHSEQGFGDTIHAVRYIRFLAEQGAHVVLSVPSELARLLAACPGVGQVVPHGELLPISDFQTLTMDLPWLFGTVRDTIPAEMPYLRVADNLVNGWRQRVSGAVKVGLVWKCGGGGRLNRELRSFDFEEYLPLLRLPDIEYYSLQVGKDALDSSTDLTYNNLHDLTADIRDFADTAALIALLDHVITIDSAVAHLAGALGKPVSLLLPAFREWRWLDQGGDSLWYPTVRVFAQAESGNWSEAIRRVTDDVIGTYLVFNKIKHVPEQRQCRLCHETTVCFYVENRPFFLCDNCRLIFTDDILSKEHTYKHYLNQHSFDFDFPGFVDKILNLMPPAVVIDRILDFGSGSGKLAEAFRSLGYTVDCYEPMFDGSFCVERYPYRYDLIIVNEVIEHVSDILATFDNLYRVCNAGGILYIGTCMSDSIIDDVDNLTTRFGEWWYKDDLTHISFFCLDTFTYLCRLHDRYTFGIAGHGPGGVLLQKLSRS